MALKCIFGHLYTFDVVKNSVVKTVYDSGNHIVKLQSLIVTGNLFNLTPYLFQVALFLSFEHENMLWKTVDR